MSSDETLPGGASDSDGWRAHELSQLRRFRALSLRQKLEAVEGMADVVRRLDQMRREGKFRSGSYSPNPRETTKKQAVGEPPAIYQRAPVSDDLELAGCIMPEPLALEGLRASCLGEYLAALGLLRAATGMEMAGRITIRGSWKNESFLLYGPVSTFNRETLCTYLLEKWKPTRFERWWSKAQAESKTDPDALPKARASEPDERVDQLDVVMVQANRRMFNDLFGTGGNIGKRNLAAVWKRSLELSKISKKPEAISWLKHTLFGIDDVSLPKLQGAGTWFVFSNKTFNSGQDWYREGRLSPWSFLLAMEGALLLRGGVHRRLGTQAKDKAVFPFMCRPTEPTTDGVVAHGKCEFWAPLWSKPATMAEIEALFRGGLAEVGGRPASAPHEFAAAALDAAVDAGVSAFIRFDLRQTTSAQVFEALPRERIHVHRYGGPRYSRLLLPLITERWIDRLPYEPKDSKQRGKFVGLRGPVESAIVHVSEDPEDSERWRSLLLLIAQTQQRIDRNRNLRERCLPVPRLHASWFERAWPDPPPELCVARAIASIQGVTERADPLLVNIFGVEMTGRGTPLFPKARPNRVVWHEGRPTRRLIDLLRRRLSDANELDPAPLHASRPCSIATAALYLAGTPVFDDELLARWLPALTLIHWSWAIRNWKDKSVEPPELVHPLYSLFRPLVDSQDVRVNGKPLFPFNLSDSRKPHVAAIRSIINLLLQNQIDEAVAHARRRYLGAGWRTFDPPVSEMVVDAERLAAALLIPVDPVEVADRFRKDWLLPSLKHE
jgi:CRISPR-associated protein Csx17